VFTAEPIKEFPVTLQLQMLLYLAILLFDSICSMGRGLSVHLAALVISKGTERLEGGGMVGEGEKVLKV